jgi:hypothetical protein
MYFLPHRPDTFHDYVFNERRDCSTAKPLQLASDRPIISDANVISDANSLKKRYMPLLVLLLLTS